MFTTLFIPPPPLARGGTAPPSSWHASPLRACTMHTHTHTSTCMDTLNRDFGFLFNPVTPPFHILATRTSRKAGEYDEGRRIRLALPLRRNDASRWWKWESAIPSATAISPRRSIIASVLVLSTKRGDAKSNGNAFVNCGRSTHFS